MNESKSASKFLQERRMSILFAAGILLGLCIGFVLGITLGFYKVTGIEKNFENVTPGMTSGQALKTIFDDFLVFPDKPHPDARIEKWSLWGYNVKKMILARFWGARPFTLTVDTATDKITKAGYESNSRFD